MVKIVNALAIRLYPQLQKVLRVNRTYYGNRNISFVTKDGIEVQMVMQHLAAWAGDWGFVTGDSGFFHGSRPMYTVAWNSLLALRSSR